LEFAFGPQEKKNADERLMKKCKEMLSVGFHDHRGDTKSQGA